MGRKRLVVDAIRKNKNNSGERVEAKPERPVRGVSVIVIVIGTRIPCEL